MYFVYIVKIVTIYLCEYLSTVTQATMTERIMNDSCLFVIIKIKKLYSVINNKYI